jgi:hypothetical protein
MELWENIRLIPVADTIEDLYIVLLLGIVNLINKLYRWDCCQSTNQIFLICGINPNL